MMSLASELFAVADDLREKSNSSANLGPDQLDDLATFLQALARLARNQEQELSVFRLAETGNLGRAIVNDLATEAMGNLLLDDAKVIRPDFSGRKK